MVRCKNKLLLKMGAPAGLSQHNVEGHKMGKINTTSVLPVSI